MNTPAFETAVEAALQLPLLSIGLHFNLTAGYPVSPADAVPSLIDRLTGRFHPLSRLIALAAARKIHSADVARECVAQLARLRGTGLSITHVDSHQHVHVLPEVWKAVVDAVRVAGIGPIRVPLEPPATMLWRPGAALGQVLLAASYRAASRGVIPPRRLKNFRGFALTGRRDFEHRLLALLDALPPGTTELMVHPGYPDDELAVWAGYTVGRERELASLTSEAVRARLARGDIELVSFGSL